MKRILIIILFFLYGKLEAQNSLNQLLQIAAENNPALQAKFSQYMAALEQVPQVGSLPDPTVAFGYFIQPIETRLGPQQARISVSQMFPWFGTLSARENTAKSFAKAKYELFEENKSKLFYQVKSAYYNLFFNEKATRIILKNIQILSSFERLAKIKTESSSASAVDIYRIEMEKNDLQNQLALLQDNDSLLRVKFSKLLNIERDSLTLVADSIPSTNLGAKRTLLDNVLKNNHLLSSFDFQIEGLGHRKNAASKEGLPQFSIGLDYSFIGKGNSTASNTGQDAFVFPTIGMTIPLYRSKYKARVREVVHLQKAKEHEKQDQKNWLTVLFETIWKDYQDANRRLSLYQKQTDLAQKSLAILETNYATNNLSFEEVLRMEHKLLKYALELQKARTDKAASVAFIHYLQGQ